MDRFGVVRLIVALAALLLAGAGRAEEVIRRFAQTIEMSAADRLRVTEAITVRAEGVEIRRGIFRDIPLRFDDAGGRMRSAGFELVSVTRNGRPEPHRLSVDRRGARIVIGEADVMLPVGEHVYTIVYDTTRQIRRFPDHDELYWNVTGTDWRLPIERASVAVRLPPGARPTRTTAFTGPLDARGTDWRLTEEPGRLLFATTRRLEAGEGLTVVVALPAGTIAPPTQAEEAAFLLADNRDRLIAGGGLLVVLAYAVVAWWRVGRDPPAGTVIPLFAPPAGISPALAHYVDARGFSGGGWTALAAACLSLAVRGLVTLDTTTGLALARTGTRPPPDLPPDEAHLLAWLDRRGGHAVVDRAIGPAVVSLGTGFRKAVTAETRTEYFRRNRVVAAGGIVLAVAVVVATIALGHPSEADVAILIPLAVAGGFLTVAAINIAGALRRRSASALAGALVITVVTGIAATLAGGGAVALAATGEVDPLFPASVAGIVAVLAVFLALIGAPTAAGRRVMDDLDGLKLYMTVAEAERLNLPGAPPVTPSRFETLLPYAVALGVERPWTQALEGHLAAAGTAGAYQPAWMTGGSRDGRLADRLAGTVGGLSSSFSSAVPPPKSSSSGFSSGGGSGRGGGGGGGGGW